MSWTKWNAESVITAVRAYCQKHGRWIFRRELRSDLGLPNMKTVRAYVGDLTELASRVGYAPRASGPAKGSRRSKYDHTPHSKRAVTKGHGCTPPQHALDAFRELMWLEGRMPSRTPAYRKLIAECCRRMDAPSTIGHAMQRGRRKQTPSGSFTVGKPKAHTALEPQRIAA